MRYRIRRKAREPIKIMAEGGMVGTNQPMQMKGIADVLANQGRYGDTMLVHMNPAEVQGLASLSPTGSLTVNPQTGQPEAFLGVVLGALGALGAGTGALGGVLAGLSPALAGAIGSGLGTYIETGDFKKSLFGGIAGYGLGKFASGLGGEVAKNIAGEGVAQSVADVVDPSVLAGTTGQTAGFAPHSRRKY